MDTMSNLISLGVGTTGPEQHAETFQDLSELARNLAVSHSYVNLNTQTVGDDEDAEDADTIECAAEHLRHDENTIFKVRAALASVLVENQDARPMDDIITDCITQMQNAGILFRERGVV